MDEIIEEIENFKDRLENIKATLSMPIPDKLYVQALRELIPNLKDDITKILKLTKEIENLNIDTLTEESLKEVIKEILEKEFGQIFDLSLYILEKGLVHILLVVFKDKYCGDNELFSRTFMFKLDDKFKSKEDLFNYIISTNKR